MPPDIEYDANAVVEPTQLVSVGHVSDVTCLLSLRGVLGVL